MQCCHKKKLQDCQQQPADTAGLWRWVVLTLGPRQSPSPARPLYILVPETQHGQCLNQIAHDKTQACFLSALTWSCKSFEFAARHRKLLLICWYCGGPVSALRDSTVPHAKLLWRCPASITSGPFLKYNATSLWLLRSFGADVHLAHLAAAASAARTAAASSDLLLQLLQKNRPSAPWLGSQKSCGCFNVIDSYNPKNPQGPSNGRVGLNLYDAPGCFLGSSKWRRHFLRSQDS